MKRHPREVMIDLLSRAMHAGRVHSLKVEDKEWFYLCSPSAARYKATIVGRKLDAEGLGWMIGGGPGHLTEAEVRRYIRVNLH